MMQTAMLTKGSLSFCKRNIVTSLVLPRRTFSIDSRASSEGLFVGKPSVHEHRIYFTGREDSGDYSYSIIHMGEK